MELKISKNGGILNIAVIGSLNTQTALELEKSLGENEDGTKEIILDFGQLEYISSAGLRVILTTQNKMDDIDGNLIIKNVGKTIREVFDMTGFTSILTLE